MFWRSGRLLALSGWRFYGQHKLQALFVVVGIAAGVALITGLEQARGVAVRSFELSTEGISGATTHVIQRVDDRPLPDSLYIQLRVTEGITEVFPVIEGFVVPVIAPGYTLRVVGLDWLARSPVRGSMLPLPDSVRLPIAELVTKKGALLSQRVATDLGLATGDSLSVTIGGKISAVTVAAILPGTDDGLGQTLLVDIATAQQLLSQTGLTRIEVQPVHSDAEALVSQLSRLLPAGVSIQPVGTRSKQMTEMTAAFSQNLRALSLLALVVGMFLIYNTLSFLLLQRVPWLSRLRAMGVTRGELLRLILRESLVLGVVGSAMGVAAGLLLSRFLTDAIVGSISDLYFTTQVRAVGVQWQAVAAGFLLGLVTTLVSALGPARSATHIPPRLASLRSAQEETVQRRPIRYWLMVAVLAVLGVLGLFLSDTGLLGGYVGLLSALLAVALLVPQAVVGGVAVLAFLSRPLQSTYVRLALRGVTASLSRSGTAITALTVAVAMTIGVSLMVASFRTTVIVWLKSSLEADVYINPPGLLARRNDQVIDPRFLQGIDLVPGVAAVSAFRDLVTTVNGRATNLIATTTAGVSSDRYRFSAGEFDTAWKGFLAGGVLVSEPFAYRHNVTVGDSVTLPTDRGNTPLPITGVYYDYASDLGVVLIHRTTYDRLFDDRAVSGMSLYLTPTADTATVLTALRQKAAGIQRLDIRTTGTLLQSSIAIFDRTFAITQGLRVLTLIVAFIGLLGALFALALERRRELGILRTLGLLPNQVWGLLMTQTGVMGLLAGVFAIPVGIGLAWGLVFVVNLRSFGWTLQFGIDPSVLIGGVLLATVAALLAAVVPALRVGRISPAAAIRYEAL